MKLDDILKNIDVKEIIGGIDIEIDYLSQDTREVFTQNTLYFAVPGTQVDGHKFVNSAIEKGSIAVVCEKIVPIPYFESFSEGGVFPTIEFTFIIVDSVSDVMGQMASNFYDNPSEKLNIIAVTGTNGKTTIATILYQSLLKLDKKAALFSTAGDFINGSEIKTNKKASSSMEIIEFQKNLKKAVESDCEYVCIEATSHALDQNRLSGTKIRGAIYTNLTQDHLDYHKDLDSYLTAKKKLFNILDESSFALVNIDDKHGAEIVSETKAKIISYGDLKFNNKINRDIVFEVLDFGLNGTKVNLDNNIVDVNLVGKFNMYNILSVYGALIELGFNKINIAESFKKIRGANGRMEIVSGKKEGVIGIVDYAHTPDALKNVLETLLEIPHNKTITVIGVGGDRDRKKRPQMAKIAQENSNYVIFTSDNPRTEDPVQIFNDLLSGCDKSNMNHEKIEDREGAIKKAVEVASSDDIILIAGKGHEDYQIIGKEKIHFDDKEVLKKYL